MPYSKYCLGLFIVAYVCVNLAVVQAQQSTYPISLQWSETAKSLAFHKAGTYIDFKGAAYDEAQPMLPLWVKNIPLSEYALLRAHLKNAVYEPLTDAVDFGGAITQSDPKIWTATTLDRKRPVGNIQILPLRKNPSTGQLEKLLRADLVVHLDARRSPVKTSRSASNTLNSALKTGKIYKFYLEQTGIYKLDYAFLQTLGVEVDKIDPRNIQLLGNGGRALAENTSVARVDDLMENAIEVIGESDGRFDSEDYILFYGLGTKHWNHVDSLGRYQHRQNIYTDESHYFLKIASTPGKRIGKQASLTTTNITTSTYDICTHYESDEVNLMEQEFALPASGREWYGEAFQITRNRTFSLATPNRIPSEPVHFYINMATRSISSTSTLSYSANGTALGTENVSKVLGNLHSPYAKASTLDKAVVIPGGDISVQIDFSNPSTDAKAWLNYISIHAKGNLNYSGGQMEFFDQNTLGKGTATFQLSNARNATIWDVTDPYAVKRQEKNADGNSFGATVDGLKKYVAFDGSGFFTPLAVGKIPNQNLHGITAPPEILIVYHPAFANAVEQLAAHRRNRSGRSVLTANVFEIYNEFSSGNKDATAIRDFAKMLYDRSAGTDSLKTILLFGDGSFDYKSIGRDAGSNPDFIPVYETAESLNPIVTFTSDDYFTLLDDGEGNVNKNEALDVGIGRIPARTTTEALGAVAKIIDYETKPSHMEDWRNSIAFVADDEDANIHINDAEEVATNIESAANDYRQEKIYFDAYKQVTTSGGSRYPDVNEAILNALFKGALVVSYLGHGADDGWGQERVFTNAEINALENKTKLPLFITATCSFAPYDNPNLNSAGERLIMNAGGGAIALMTTVRVVYANANLILTKNTFEQLFKPVDTRTGEMPNLGEVLRRAKNSSGILNRSNSRKFSLLGDPSMVLAYPKYNVVTTQISNATGARIDTIRALQKVKITGEVHDLQGNLMPNFNGVIYPTVYDKKNRLTTLVNDAGSNPKTFSVRQKVIFKGNASVNQGKFAFEFVVPKDINYELGSGQISYYAKNDLEDANGVYNSVTVGGTDSNAVTDQIGPEVSVFMNDDKFAFGGLTDANPLLYVELYDASGINTIGNGIGRDLSSELNLSTKESQTHILNDFYTALRDSYTEGTVSYPLKELPDGRHTIRVKAWDVFNNLGEGSTEFVVASNAKLALQHVLNYPNPFTTHTHFQFEHNLPGQTLDVQIQIFTVAGTLVKTIRETVYSQGYRVTDLPWNGLDEFGDRIGRGLYIYKIVVRAAAGSDGDTKQESEYQKLVILR